MSDSQVIPEAAVAAALDALGVHGPVTQWVVNTALEAAAPHMLVDVITSVEELVALPGGSVILSDEGGVFEAIEAWNRDESEYGIQWMETGTSWRLESSEIALPVTVLHRPAP